MIKYYVRTTNERTLDKTYEQIDYEKLVDADHKPTESFIEQLKIISEFDSVLLEDDLILCKDFKNHIEKIIKQYPNCIINFFQKPSLYFNTYVTDEPFRYNQCTYYPKGLSKQIAEVMETYDKRNYKYGYDVIEDWALQKMNIAYVIFRPCLVQHIDNKSIISINAPKRRSIYFIDYLDELKISYEEAYLHKKELTELMNSKFK